MFFPMSNHLNSGEGSFDVVPGVTRVQRAQPFFDDTKLSGGRLTMNPASLDSRADSKFHIRQA